MHPATLLAFILLETALCFVPGPAVLSVLGAALGRGPRSGFATASGILTGNLVYFILSALGLVAILTTSHVVFTIVKWCGAGYLAYLGVRTLFAQPREISRESVGEEALRLGARGWRNGTLVQLSNPKALVFFTAILPQFVDPHADVPFQLALLGAAGLAVELAVLSVYVLGAEYVRRHGIGTRSQAWAERAGGLFLIGVAAAVVREST